MTIFYQPPSGVELNAIATSEDMGDAMVDLAEQGRAYAESIAPVDTGAYRGKFRVEDVGRGEAHLVNDDEAAAAIEFGTDDTPAHGTLTQTADLIEGV